MDKIIKYINMQLSILKRNRMPDLKFYNDNMQEVDISKCSIPPKLNIKGYYDILIDQYKMEYPEQFLAYNFINYHATVLELGARFGSVSCAINKKLMYKTNQVSVEPDKYVWDTLDYNIKANDCNVFVHKGIVSKTNSQLIHLGYGSYTVSSESTTLNCISVEDLQLKYNLVFDTVVADCEGFLETFFDEHLFLYDQLNTVIFEADSQDRCNYDKIRKNLREHGFYNIISGFQNVYKKF